MTGSEVFTLFFVILGAYPIVLASPLVRNLFFFSMMTQRKFQLRLSRSDLANSSILFKLSQPLSTSDITGDSEILSEALQARRSREIENLNFNIHSTTLNCLGLITKRSKSIDIYLPESLFKSFSQLEIKQYALILYKYQSSLPGRFLWLLSSPLYGLHLLLRALNDFSKRFLKVSLLNQFITLIFSFFHYPLFSFIKYVGGFFLRLLSLFPFFKNLPLQKSQVIEPLVQKAYALTHFGSTRPENFLELALLEIQYCLGPLAFYTSNKIMQKPAESKAIRT